MTTYIYTLSDPRDNTVRYVGISEFPGSRVREHINDLHATSLKREWLDSMKNEGVLPIFATVEKVSWQNRFIREKTWIEHFKEHGASLVNTVHNREINKTSRIIIDVDPGFHKAVKMAALSRDKTIRELVLECLHSCLKDAPADVEALLAAPPVKRG